MTTSDPVKCWIDEQGIVWSHDCEGKATPALAIPLPVVEKVREAIQAASTQLRFEACTKQADALDEARTALGGTKA